MPASASANRAQADASATRTLSPHTNPMQPTAGPLTIRARRAASLRARNLEARAPSFHID
jgi:hypothetical protein